MIKTIVVLTVLSALSTGEHRPRVIIVEQPGCGWCVKYNNEVLSNPVIQKELAKFTVTRLNSMRGTHANGTPTTEIINSSGHETDLVGYQSVSQLLSALHANE